MSIWTLELRFLPRTGQNGLFGWCAPNWSQPVRLLQIIQKFNNYYQILQNKLNLQQQFGRPTMPFSLAIISVHGAGATLFAAHEPEHPHRTPDRASLNEMESCCFTNERKYHLMRSPKNGGFQCENSAPRFIEIKTVHVGISVRL